MLPWEGDLGPRGRFLSGRGSGARGGHHVPCRVLSRGACVACWRQLGGLRSVLEPQGVQLPGTQAGLFFFASFSFSFIYEKKKNPPPPPLFFFVRSWNNEVQISFMLERFDPGSACCGFAGGWEKGWG